VTYFSNFGTPPNISGTAEDSKIKFYKQIEGNAGALIVTDTEQKDEK